MRRSTKFLIIFLLLAGLAGVAGGLFWHMSNHVLIDKTFYPKDLQELDLRGEEVSVSRYERLQRLLPECHILWDVPFQDRRYPCGTQVLSVSTLAEEDLDRLRYFDALQQLDGTQCTDYEVLMLAAETYPKLAVTYQVTLGGTAYSQDTRVLTFTDVRQEELSLLDALPRLESVSVSAVGDPAATQALQDYCARRGLEFTVLLAGQVCPVDTQSLTLTQVTDEELALLQLLPQLKSLHLHDPAASLEKILALEESGIAVDWDVTLCGTVYGKDTAEIDLSDASISSVEEVETALSYLPEVKNVFLGLCGLDNEEIAAFRERNRENYKVVWTVDLSGKMQVRTDITNFMPSRDGWGYVRDGEVNNIRYCEELVCIDLGHMGIRDVSFLEPLVNLEYLILAHTEVRYIDAISNCKKLKFLELDWSPIQDVSPLLECKALEDLNLGMAWPDITPVLEMTWLKNLWLIKGNTRANFAAALPDTRVVATGEYTVSSGWRQLPNYYAMRDILGMPYM